MEKDKQHIEIAGMGKYTCKRAGARLYTSLAAAILFLLPGSLSAQSGTLYDGVNSNLTNANNFIYFGKYRHATGYETEEDGSTVKLFDGSMHVTHESDSTPILWRVMGREAGAATLMSQYVIDTLTYGADGEDWGTSRLYHWLNTNGFPSSFTAEEKRNVQVNPVVNAPKYSVNYTLTPWTYSCPGNISSSNTTFYLPWGTPLATGTTVNNSVHWSLAASITGTPSNVDSTLLDKHASLKGNPANYVYYWLRNLRGDISDFVQVVQPSGNVDMQGIGVSMGVRPMFRLDTSQVIFAAELTDRANFERLDQDMTDNTDDYRDGEAVSDETAVSATVFKLTVCDGKPNPDKLPYDYDEILAVGGTVAVKPGDTVRLGRGATSVAGYDSAAYKLVRDGLGGREVLRRGFTPATTNPNDSLIEIVARNIYTDSLWNSLASSFSDPNLDAKLLNGSCDAYIWLQKNNRYQSHSGTETMHFNLHIIADNNPPEISLTGKISRRSSGTNAADTAIIALRIKEDNGGKYYYLVDPASPPTSAADFINNNTALVRSGKKIFGTGSPAVIDTVTGLGNNNPRTIYFLAKDSVRNTSQILQLNIPIYVPNTKPDSIPLTVYLQPGESKTLSVYDIASDPDVAAYGDVLKITSVDIPSDASIASALIVTPDSTQLRFSAPVNAVGDTAVYVTVKDYDRDSTQCRVGIVVRAAPPAAEIDYVEETLAALLAPGRYLFTNADTVIDRVISGPVEIDGKWFGTTIDIVRLNPSTGAPLTAVQQLAIPSRPVAPDIRAYGESFGGFEDGRIAPASDAMEYRADTVDVWTAVRSGRTEIIDLYPGVYLVRYKAVVGRQFASYPATAVIATGGAYPQINREIVLPAVDGVTTLPASGSHRIPSSTSFTFSITFSGEPLKVTTNRVTNEGEEEVLTGVPNESGGFDYLIRRIVTTPVVVTIGPESNGNEPINPTLSVWAFRGTVYIRASQSGVANVYALSGSLIAQVKTVEGETASIPLPSGVYVIALGDGKRAKTIVR